MYQKRSEKDRIEWQKMIEKCFFCMYRLLADDDDLFLSSDEIE